jgi:D-alanyl-D-alanine dipeptidase
MKNLNSVMAGQLCRSLVTYQNLLTIEDGISTEEFVLLDDNPQLPLFGHYQKLTDMQVAFPRVPVRQTVYEKLMDAATQLQKIRPDLSLQVTYGYRSPAVQAEYFAQYSQLQFGRTDLSEEEKEVIHRLIAVPTVAGHPTGGAVDVTLVNSATGQMLDCGSTLYDLEDINIFYYSPLVTGEPQRNRQLLRDIMTKQEFFPFDGEWWHFSYGDGEWKIHGYLWTSHE